MLSGIEILTIASLPIHEPGMFIHLFKSSLIFFPTVFCSFLCTGISPPWLIPRYFILFDAILNITVFLISLIVLCQCVKKQLILHVNIVCWYFAKFVYSDTFLCVYSLKIDYFKSHFAISTILSRRYRDFSYTSCPHTCIASLFNQCTPPAWCICYN